MYNYYLYPVPYTLEVFYMDGPLDEVGINYSCSECGDYGLQDKGSMKIRLSIDFFIEKKMFFFAFLVHINVVTRDKSPNCTTMEKAMKMLSAHNISLSDLVKIDHENC